MGESLIPAPPKEVDQRTYELGLCKLRPGDIIRYTRRHNENPEYAIVRDEYWWQQGQPLFSFSTWGDGGRHHGLDTISFDRIKVPSPEEIWQIEAVERVELPEALDSIKDRMVGYQAVIDDALHSDDDVERLFACITARLQFRLAELYIALQSSDDVLRTMWRNHHESKIEPDTGAYILYPLFPNGHEDDLVKPQLFYLINENPTEIPENGLQGVNVLAGIIFPYLFGQDAPNGSSYAAYAIPESARELHEGLDALILTIPPAETGVVITVQPEEDKRRDLERINQFLLTFKGIN